MHWWRSFTGASVPGYRQRKRVAQGLAFVWMLAGFAATYWLSEFLIARSLHPLHWTVAGIGAVVLYCLGYIWLLRRAYLQQTGKRWRRQ